MVVLGVKSQCFFGKMAVVYSRKQLVRIRGQVFEVEAIEAPNCSSGVCTKRRVPRLDFAQAQWTAAVDGHVVKVGIITQGAVATIKVSGRQQRSQECSSSGDWVNVVHARWNCIRTSTVCTAHKAVANAVIHPCKAFQRSSCCDASDRDSRVGSPVGAKC